jgi:hypothetical protein
MKYLGQEGEVTKYWNSNRTVLIKFDDGAEFDFPMEAIWNKR